MFTAPTAAEAEFLASQYLFEQKEATKPENKTIFKATLDTAATVCKTLWLILLHFGVYTKFGTVLEK